VQPVAELLLERGDLQPEQQHLILDVTLSLTPVNGLVLVGTGAPHSGHGLYWDCEYQESTSLVERPWRQKRYVLEV